MRVTSILASAALLLAPAVLAEASLPSGDWSGETTITVTSSYSTTLTVTKTLTYVNGTGSSYSAHPTGWNVTSAVSAATTVNKPTLTASTATSTTGVVIASATGAASAHEINLAVAALAGAAAMVWGSL